jgi:ATP-binding cassette subfamily C protein CydD
MKASEKRTLRHDRRIALIGLLADVPGAALVAAGLALGVATIARPGLADSWLAAVLLGAGGMVRAGSQWLAANSGLKAGLARKAEARARHWPWLLSAPGADRLSGDGLGRAVDSIEMLEGLEARFRPLRSAAVASPPLVALVVAAASPVSAAILLITLPLFAAGLALAGTAARATAERQLGALRDLNALFADRLRAFPEIRHFHAEDRILRQMRDSSRELARRTLATLRIAFLSGGVIEFFAAIAVALVAVYAGFSLLGILPVRAPETLTLLSAFFVLAMAPEFYQPFRRLAAAYHDRQLGEAAEAELATPAPCPVPGTAAFSGLAAEGFVVRHADGPEIGPVRFRLGETGLVALVGPTGSGKSSVLAAIAGRAPLSAGALVWAGEAPPPLGWAGQRPLILSGTLAGNLALARPGTPDAAILSVADSLGLSPLIAARGLHGAIDWRGSGLSGGERRRIGVARALLSGRPLLLLDEPTADLDAASAARVRSALADAARSRAILVATHDKALAALAGQVVVLE